MRTRVGYTGGGTPHPTYHDLADHTEAFQVDYDPEVVGYDELLARFWAGHDPFREAHSHQYRAAIWVHDEEQGRLAHGYAARLSEERGRSVKTAILPAMHFTLAEDYHQKYFLRQHPVLGREYAERFPALEDFLASTAVTRVNGLLRGNGSREAFERDVDTLGLSPEGREALQSAVADA